MPDILEMVSVGAEEFRSGPMPVSPVSPKLWQQAAGDLARGQLTLLGLWADRGSVRMALFNSTTGKVGVLRTNARRGAFPSVGALHAPAQRLERSVQDLYGHVPEGATDARPWLDHGAWEVSHPLGKAEKAGETASYDFLPVEGESLHQVAVGPVHAGVIEPGHFRFTVQGETVVRLEQRFGYTHKGTDSLMTNAPVERGAKLAGRTSGDSTVAYAWAFAQAVEAALGATVPVRALWLRALMAELERLANHLGDIGAICNDAAFAMMLAQCSVLRERVLRACDGSFGHRMMRDCVTPGGVARDLDGTGRQMLLDLVADIRGTFPSLVALYDQTASLLDRTTGTGIVTPALAARFGAGGFVGRASGRDFDARRDLPYAPYDQLRFEVPCHAEGDVNARILIRMAEVEQSLSLITQILRQLPEGDLLAELPVAGEPREGLGLVEGFRGDILIFVSLDAKGRLANCHMRDPSWFQWPLLEAAIEGNIIADFPLCNKSFNCSYSGQDR
ncbi:hydrogenase large subunit [Frigidibacter sp. ROC022]|uniref:hydrogenase large subunit n=1 Tax=Frigidibacter sp. ROC022 TaxID=2971796 RepID=UPI00215A21C5|nr:NADH-quinone oxidoreductase subunit C [Frigidibacter sp. ROC022]MCR8725511.1 NADH-quinone oxidoreductase subunit C [Frigidibacter sp. ROC022]